jgi:hypothetical protein
MAAYESYWNNLRWQLIWPDMKDKLKEMEKQVKRMRKWEEKEKALLADQTKSALAAQVAENEVLKHQLAAMRQRRS